MELSDYRAELDRMDEALVELFCQRMTLCRQIGRYKKQHGLPVLDAAREEEKLKTLTALAPEDFSDQVEALYRVLFALSRQEQETYIQIGGTT